MFGDDQTKFTLEGKIQNQARTVWVGYIIEEGTVKRFKWSLELDIGARGKLRAEGVEDSVHGMKLEGKVTHLKKRLATGQDDFHFVKTRDNADEKVHFNGKINLSGSCMKGTWGWEDKDEQGYF